MRVLGVLIMCSVLAAQAFAGQEIGRRAVRAALKNGALIQDLAATHGVLPTAINSSNIGKFMKSKIDIHKIRDAIVAGGFAALLLVPGVVQADTTKKIQEIDKAAKVAKIDAVAERQFKSVVGLSGSYVSSTKKDDSLLLGANYHANYKYKLASFNAKVSGVLNNTKTTGGDDWTRRNDITGRANYIQAFEVNGRDIMPIGILDGGASHYGHSRRLADITGSIGVQASGKYLDRDIYIQLRAGGGLLGQAKYTDGAFPELDGEAVVVFGVNAKLPWITMGDAVGAADGSLLYFFPLIPGGELEYSRYYKADDWGIATDRLNASLALTKELSLKGELTDRTGEDRHHTIMVNLELTDIFSQ